MHLACRRDSRGHLPIAGPGTHRAEVSSRLGRLITQHTTLRQSVEGPMRARPLAKGGGSCPRSVSSVSSSERSSGAPPGSALSRSLRAAARGARGSGRSEGKAAAVRPKPPSPPPPSRTAIQPSGRVHATKARRIANCATPTERQLHEVRPQRRTQLIDHRSAGHRHDEKSPKLLDKELLDAGMQRRAAGQRPESSAPRRCQFDDFRSPSRRADPTLSLEHRDKTGCKLRVL